MKNYLCFADGCKFPTLLGIVLRARRRLQSFPERGQQVGTGHRNQHINMMDNVERFVLHGVRKVGQVVRQVEHLLECDLAVVELLRDGLDEGAPLGLGVTQQRVQEAVERGGWLGGVANPEHENWFETGGSS